MICKNWTQQENNELCEKETIAAQIACIYYTFEN